MSEMTLDPSKGFVALPLDLFDYDLTPGAFRTLVEFCRMANSEGSCWPSLAQLSERLGRSRAAISGYISELRAIELLTTETQRTANGFNYRLKYHLPFWAQWKRRFTASSAKKQVQSTECRVQPAERPKENKNHTYKNNSSTPGRMNNPFLSDLLKKWQSLTGSAPYPAFATSPNNALITETMKACGSYVPDKSITAEQLVLVFAHFGVSMSSTAAVACSKVAHGMSLEMISSGLKDAWKPHWERPPSIRQFEQLVESFRPKNDPAQAIRLLQTYLNRAKTAGFPLPALSKTRISKRQSAGLALSYPRI